MVLLQAQTRPHPQVNRLMVTTLVPCCSLREWSLGCDVINNTMDRREYLEEIILCCHQKWALLQIFHHPILDTISLSTNDPIAIQPSYRGLCVSTAIRIAAWLLKIGWFHKDLLQYPVIPNEFRLIVL